MNGERREPGTDFLFALSQEFGKSVDWLLTGKEHAEQGNEWPRMWQNLDVTALNKLVT